MGVLRDKSTADIATLFDVTTRAVSKWVKEGLPYDAPKKKNQSAKYNETEVAAWMKANKKTGKPGRPANEALNAAKLRKETAMAIKYEIENKVSMGLLVDAASEQQRNIAKITTVRNRLCGLGATLSPALEGLDGAERQAAIDEAVEQILKEFSAC